MPPITWAHTAASCPPLPTRPTAILDPADDQQATTTAFRIGPTNDTPAPTMRAGVDANGKRLDQLGRYGGGCPAILEGCQLSVSATPNCVDISPGVIKTDGPANVGKVDPLNLHLPRTALTQALTDNATNHLWFLRDGTPTVLTDLTVPDPLAAYRGRAVMAAGTITEIDYSGSVEMRWGLPYRRTNDAGAPGDTPPADASFLAETAAGLFLALGGTYHLVTSAQAVSPGPPTITPGVQTSHTRPVTIQLKDASGANLATKRLVRLWLSDAALGGETATVPDGGLAVTTGTILKVQTTDKHLLVLTDATGAAVVTITHSAAITYHLVAELAGQITDASVALT